MNNNYSYNNKNNNCNSNSNKDNLLNQEIPYNFEYVNGFKNENLDFIIQPQLQQFYQQQYQQQKQQLHQQQQQQQQQQPNSQIESHQLINILDPFQKDKIVLKKGDDGLFSTTEAETTIPPSILPMSRFYEIVDEINRYYEKEFFIYNRLIKLTFSLTLITIVLSLVLFLTSDISNNNQNAVTKGKHNHHHHNKSNDNGEISIRFLLPLSMSIIFLIFYLITSYIRYISCPKNMEDYCSTLSNRFSNLSFNYYSGEWGRFEKITIKFPRIHIHPVVYIYVDHNKIDNNKPPQPFVDNLFS
ncbi:hypothetical protein RB653_007046 [Dictyostelium firmibasis]|uniref:Transmembrane protein n=1 Tax=Dictyostelium firmibasis TaxID=79012 RepID=A0AAN7YNP0_9MYCE